jgi:hypothetical protein
LAKRSGNSIYTATALRVLGEHLAQRQRWSDAKKRLNESAALFRRANLQIDSAYCALVLAECDLGQAISAHRIGPLSHVQRRLNQVEQAAGALPDVHARVALARAELARRRGNPTGAMTYVASAVQDVRLIRACADDPVLSSHIAATYEHVYAHGAQLASELRDDDATLAFIEHRRAHWLARFERGFRSSHALAADAQAEELARELHQLRLQISGVWRSEPVNQNAASLQDAVRQLRSRYERYDAASMSASAADSTLQRAARPTTTPMMHDIAGLRAAFNRRFGAAWTAIEIEPWQHNAWLIVRLTPDAFATQVVSASKVMHMHLRHLTEPGLDHRRKFYSAPDTGKDDLAELMRWLNVEAWLPENALPHATHNTRHTLIVADCEPFTRLAFGALPLAALSDRSRLGQVCALRFAPSLNLAALWAKRAPNGHHAPARNRLKALFIAPVTFKRSHEPLPHTLREVKHCARFFDQSRALLHDQASLAAMRQLRDSGALETFDVIHFATHAFHHPEQPRLSGIALYDGDLTTQELLSWQLKTRLVCISACESAGAVTMGGEERIGIQTALIAAGARNVLASSWPVVDDRTASMMADFYRAYLAQGDAGAALGQMQRKRAMAVPFEWAGWRVMGMR